MIPARFNSEGYVLCDSDSGSQSTISKESRENLQTSSNSLYENNVPLIRVSSSQTLDESSYYLTSGNKIFLNI